MDSFTTLMHITGRSFPLREGKIVNSFEGNRQSSTRSNQVNFQCFDLGRVHREPASWGQQQFARDLSAWCIIIIGSSFSPLWGSIHRRLLCCTISFADSQKQAVFSQNYTSRGLSHTYRTNSNEFTTPSRWMLCIFVASIITAPCVTFAQYVYCVDIFDHHKTL